MPRRAATASAASIVATALASCRGAFVAVGVFSGLINLLMLSGSLYMLQVYDRVLSSRSVPTLIGLSLLLLAAFALQGFLEAIRLRLLSRIGARFNEQVSPAAFAAAQKLPLMGGRPEQAMQPIRDLDQIRAFLASLGPTAFFDMPWMPLFFAGCFLLHPWLGWLAVGGGLVVVLLSVVTERSSRAAMKAQAASSVARHAIAEASRRNAEALTAMGMAEAFERKWRQADRHHVQNWLAGADATSGIGSLAKVLRMALQSAVLGLGAYLSLRGEISGGAMIAASIMASRALAPIEVAIAHWRGFAAARQGKARLKQVLDSSAFLSLPRTELPRPERGLSAEALVVAAPGRQMPILHGVSLQLEAGQGVGIIGPSASGKSTLVRTLVGAWHPLKGEVRLDGAALSQWEPRALGHHIGYLPQDIELFDGSVADNIARFQPDVSDDTIVAAAKAAGAHDLIVKLENGYETMIGEGGAALSGGQRQRIGLARALYGDPFLVVLDEPNSNLDHDGDEALTMAIRSVRSRGGIVVVVTHRQTAIAGVDHIAMMADGRITAFGSKEEILQKVLRQGGLPGIQRQAVAS
ncbi:type I secretion system permease/ATPase [Bosea sp. PAMC 26642]|uniref:type I secretion system permease/ATPase n=1 Tax=Bosea sp. (strain PAMC 26642) TaxID=1792307 RepID=UPI00077006C6|nr:type I secretion system permease/ATPase [Bosea sp. PAMC 26642]AMJ62437.1 type I secretion protein [Bosea sp. PAMC 26642]